MKKTLAVLLSALMIGNMGIAVFASEPEEEKEELAPVSGEAEEKEEDIEEIIDVDEDTDTDEDAETEEDADIDEDADAEEDADVDEDADEDADTDEDADEDNKPGKDHGRGDKNSASKEEREKARKDRLSAKEDKIRALSELRELRLAAKEMKIQTLDYLKKLTGLFRGISKEDRAEFLADLAVAKKALRENTIGAFINGIDIDFSKYDNVTPEIENGRTLVPLRAVVEALGADVDWDEDTQTITLSYEDDEIVMTVGEKTAYVNGEEVSLEVSPRIRDGRTLVPVRFIAETFGLTVEWDAESETIIIE